MASEDTKRLARNTAALYVRMLFAFVVKFYTARVILEVLGVKDFGVYNLVGSVIGMMGFINNTMRSVTMRYLTIDIGKKDYGHLREVFAVALLIHFFIGAIVVAGGETIGVWLIRNKLSIPAGSMTAALWVFQFVIFSTFVSILQVPYNAALIAHEKFDVYAVLEILHVLLQLAIVFALLLISTNKLILYGGLIFAVTVIIAGLYRWYTMRHFKECRVRLTTKIDGVITRSMLKFSSWDIVGNMSTIARTAGVGMVVNMFYGVVANAAIGIGYQVQYALMEFSGKVMSAAQPQIIKSYATANIEHLRQLMFSATKMSMILMLMIGVPIALNTHFFLQIWLGQVPEYTVWMVRLIMLMQFFNICSTVTYMVVYASGRIALNNFVTSTLFIAILPISYVAFKYYDASVYLPFYLNAAFVFVGIGVNLWVIYRVAPGVGVLSYFMKVFLPCCVVGTASYVVGAVVGGLVTGAWGTFMLSSAVSVVVLCGICWMMVLSGTEKGFVINVARRVGGRISHLLRH